MGFKIDFYKSLIDEIYNYAHNLFNARKIKIKKTLSHFVYDHLGLYLNQSLIQHGIDHPHKSGNVGAYQIVAGIAIFFSHI